MDNIWNKSDFQHERKRPWKLLRLVLRNIKYSYQRVTKGYCDKDLWSIDYWFMNLGKNIYRDIQFAFYEL